MPLVPITFSVDGTTEYSRAFALAADQARDLREPLREVGMEVIRAVGRQFETEGASEMGSRWRPLNPTYAAWKDRNYPGRPILVRTGEMRAAATDPFRSLRVDPRSLTYTIESDYAAHHQRGDGVPERRIVALSSSTRRSIDRIFAEWVSGVFGGPLFGRGFR